MHSQHEAREMEGVQRRKVEEQNAHTHTDNFTNQQARKKYIATLGGGEMW